MQLSIRVALLLLIILKSAKWHPVGYNYLINISLIFYLINPTPPPVYYFWTSDALLCTLGWYIVTSHQEQPGKFWPQA